MSAEATPADRNEPSEKELCFLDALSQSGSPELKRISIEVHDGRIVLAGHVTTYYQKQLAQEALRPLAVGMQISNKIQVAP